MLRLLVLCLLCVCVCVCCSFRLSAWVPVKCKSLKLNVGMARQTFGVLLRQSV
jgi:hypothetical protein